MKINIKDLVFLLNKLGVTANQFLFLTIIHEKLYASLYSYEELNVGFTMEERNDLIDKGYIVCISSNRKESYVDSYETTLKYEESMYNADPELAAEEFWEEFPPYIVIDGKKIPAKSVDREKFSTAYHKKIGKYKTVHEEVMKALQYAKSRNAITMGIEKWFLSEQWNEVTKLKQLESHDSFPGNKIF